MKEHTSLLEILRSIFINGRKKNNKEKVEIDGETGLFQFLLSL